MLANDFISQYPNPCRAQLLSLLFVCLCDIEYRSNLNLSLHWLDIIEIHLFLYQENLWPVLLVFCLQDTDVPASSSWQHYFLSFLSCSSWWVDWYFRVCFLATIQTVYLAHEADRNTTRRCRHDVPDKWLACTYSHREWVSLSLCHYTDPPVACMLLSADSQQAWQNARLPYSCRLGYHSRMFPQLH